jgi:hypothetical protein
LGGISSNPDQNQGAFSTEEWGYGEDTLKNGLTESFWRQEGLRDRLSAPPPRKEREKVRGKKDEGRRKTGAEPV